jgi:hypothetical protein
MTLNQISFRTGKQECEPEGSLQECEMGQMGSICGDRPWLENRTNPLQEHICTLPNANSRELAQLQLM